MAARREWDESRGVAYLPAWVLTDPGFTVTDVAVLVGRAGWSPHVSTPPAEPTTSTTTAGSSTPNGGSRRPGPGCSRPCPAPTGRNPTPASSCSGRMIGGIEDGTMRRDTVLDLVEATGIEGLLRSARNGPE